MEFYLVNHHLFYLGIFSGFIHWSPNFFALNFHRFLVQKSYTPLFSFNQHIGKLVWSLSVIQDMHTRVLEKCIVSDCHSLDLSKP